MKRASKRTLKISTAALAFLGLSTQIFAGSIYVYEMIPTEVGTAGAGSAAKAQNATTVFTNPAGMTYIDHNEIEAGATLMYTLMRLSTTWQALPVQAVAVIPPNGSAGVTLTWLCPLTISGPLDWLYRTSSVSV